MGGRKGLRRLCAAGAAAGTAHDPAAQPLHLRGMGNGRVALVAAEKAGAPFALHEPPVPNSGQKAFVYIGSPGGRSNGRLRICYEKFFRRSALTTPLRLSRKPHCEFAMWL